MAIIDHIGLAVADLARSKAFYGAVFPALDIELLMELPDTVTGTVNCAGYGRNGKPDFWIDDGAVPATKLHIAFAASTRGAVDAFYQAALAAGGTGNGGPGLRPHYHENYYGAFVIDPDGNNIEAVCHEPG